MYSHKLYFFKFSWNTEIIYLILKHDTSGKNTSCIYYIQKKQKYIDFKKYSICQT